MEIILRGKKFLYIFSLRLLFSFFFLLLEVLARLFPNVQPPFVKGFRESAEFALERVHTHHYYPGLGIVLKPGVNAKMTAQDEFEFHYRTVQLATEAIGIRD